MKAYKVSTPAAAASVIVFAPSIRRALARAHRSEWLCEEPFITLRAKRLPELDADAGDAEELLDGNCARSQRLMWRLGWNCLDGEGSCDGCGLYHWDLVPESHLKHYPGEEADLCPGCFAAMTSAADGKEAA